MNLRNKQFVFGPFRLELANQRLLRDQKRMSLAPKAFDTLVYLVENRRRPLSREELMKAIWPDSLVEGANLTVNISLRRKALGDKPDGHPYIETVPKKGYRFNAEVSLINVVAQEPVLAPALKPPDSTEVFTNEKVGDPELASREPEFEGKRNERSAYLSVGL